MKEKWIKSDKPHRDCKCTHTLSLFCGILASERLPKKMLPATPCQCGLTMRQWKNGQLWVKAGGAVHVRRKSP